METYKTREELEAGLDAILASPKDAGRVELIVCRPETDARSVLESCRLTEEDGLVGDRWKHTARKGDSGGFERDNQVNLMNARAIGAIAASRNDWPLAGDQFYVDLDLSKDNLPPGTRLAIGGAVIEVTAEPHLGCRKFSARFGRDAVTFVNSDLGKQLNLRGINAKVVKSGTVRLGDKIGKVARQENS